MFYFFSFRLSDLAGICTDLGLQSNIKPQPLCPTRFLLRVRSFRSIMKNYVALLSLMAKYGDTNEKVASKALGLFKVFSKGETVFCIMLCIELFEYLEGLSKTIQKPTASLSGILQAADGVKATLEAHATRKELFDKVWSESLAKMEEFALNKPELKRKKAVPARYRKVLQNPVNFETVEEQYLAIYQSAYQHALEEVDRRFNQAGSQRYLDMERTIISYATMVDAKAKLTDLCKDYGYDFAMLETNLKMLSYSGKEFKTVSSVVSYIKNLQSEARIPYAELVKLLRLFLLFPVSSCTPERSFSALTRVKSYLRVTMGQERLNSCIILNVYRELAGEVAVEAVCREFINSDLRKRIFGNVL